MQLGFTKNYLVQICLIFFFDEITDFLDKKKHRSSLSRFSFLIGTTQEVTSYAEEDVHCL